MQGTRIAAFATLLLLLFPVVAAAQPAGDDGPGPRASAAPPLPDATLQALRGRTIAVQLVGGAPVVGELVGFDAATLTLAVAPSRDIVTLARSGVAGLRLADAPAPASPTAATGSTTAATASTTAATASPTALVATAPEHERNFGLQLGLAPALMIDYESGRFYAFFNADIVLPMASAGDLVGVGVGAGISFPVITGSRWRLDIFAHFTPARFGSDWNIGGGIGLGMHYTARNGFTLGFKLPILGYSGFLNGSNSAGSDVGMYYLSGLMGLPVISLGYRF